MKKLAPLVLSLSLAANSLFGNPLQSTIVKEDTKQEFDFTGSLDTSSLSLDASLPMGNGWRVNFDSDMDKINGLRINNVDMAIGNKFFYIGGSFGDLSESIATENSSIFKAQAGLDLFNWLYLSATGAIVNLPNMRSIAFYETPTTLYALAGSLDIGKEFKIGDGGLFPWLSVTASRYWAKVDSESLKKVTDNKDYSDYVPENISWPFDHLNVKAGLDIELNKFLKLIYQGEYEGQFYQDSPYNFTNTAGISMQDEKGKLKMDYLVSLITKPQWYKEVVTSPFQNELQFDVDAFALFENDFFVKGKFSALVNFLTETQVNATAAIGKKFKFGNFELYYNYPNNTFGIQFSKQLDNSTDRESKLRVGPQKEIEGITDPNEIIINFSADANSLHALWGANTLEEIVTKIHSEQDLSNIISSIPFKEHDGTFSAREEWEKYGYGVCRDTNGNLIPYLEKKAFNYKAVYSVTLWGTIPAHDVAVILKQNGKYDLRDFERYYSLDADSAEKAVESVYSGAWIYGNAEVSSSVNAVRKSVESKIFDFKKYQ